MNIMRNALLALALFSSACATRLTDTLANSDAWLDAATAASARSTPAAIDSPSAPAPALIGDKGYTKFSAGSFSPIGDIDGLDTGYYAQVAFGGDVIPLVSIEGSVGYFSVDGPGGSEIAGVPLLLCARLQVPITVLKVYGGGGVGGSFVDYEAGSFDDSEFLFTGTGFLGLEVGLGNLAVGAEYRYLITEETNAGFAIEGNCGLLTLTLPF